MLLVFSDLFTLDLLSLLHLVHGHVTLFVVSYCIGFHGFFLFVLVLAFYVLWVFGIGWERVKLMEFGKSWMNPTCNVKLG